MYKEFTYYMKRLCLLAIKRTVFPWLLPNCHSLSQAVDSPYDKTSDKFNISGL